MQKVYEELLGHLKDHELLGPYLHNETPDFALIWTEVMPSLSSGEKLMMQFALALYNGNGTARFADIFMVDTDNQRRILNALTLRIRN